MAFSFAEQRARVCKDIVERMLREGEKRRMPAGDPDALREVVAQRMGHTSSRSQEAFKMYMPVGKAHKKL